MVELATNCCAFFSLAQGVMIVAGLDLVSLVCVILNIEGGKSFFVRSARHSAETLLAPDNSIASLETDSVESCKLIAVVRGSCKACSQYSSASAF